MLLAVGHFVPFYFFFEKMPLLHLGTFQLFSSRLMEDLQDQKEESLIDPMGECSLALLNLIVTGRARPYLHNGIMAVGGDGDGDGSEERVGIEGRNEMGFLLWDHTESDTAGYNLGSRLKTPVLPIWITRYAGTRLFRAPFFWSKTGNSLLWNFGTIGATGRSEFSSTPTGSS